MIASDSNIAEINTQRKKFSLLKDGKLLAPFKGKRVKVLAISDVEGDDIAVIGSGTGDIKRVRSRAQLDIIATNAIARQACQKMAQNIGFRIQMNIENLYQDVSQVANDIAQAIITGKPGVYIFGGEPTINLPANPGSGGRNQSLALELAQRIRNLDNLNVLVAGTDGTDGPTDAAGGIIDGYTAQNTLRAQAALDAANAGGFLRDIGEIFITGPTNTNVMDLVIVLKT
jgi:hydroxypyruvate reductase